MAELYTDDRLAGMSEDEKRVYLVDLVQHGPPRPNAILHAEPAGGSPPAGPTSVDVFDADADLYAPLPNRSEAFTMPNGKRLWVHPLSLEDRMDNAARVNLELRAAGLLKPNPTPEETARLQIEAAYRLQVWTVIGCCRRGESPDSARVFAAKHAAALRQNPGWAEAIEQLTRLCDTLSEGRSEATLIQEMLTGFFGQMERWLQTWLSLWSTDTPPSSTVDLAPLHDFAASVSSINQQGRPWTRQDLIALSMVLGLTERGE